MRMIDEVNRETEDEKHCSGVCQSARAVEGGERETEVKIKIQDSKLN